MTASVFVANPELCHLTNEFLRKHKLPLLYGGAFWKLRFCILAAGSDIGADLTGALVIFKVEYGANLILRKTTVTSAGAPTAQIVLDNQATGGTAGALTGKGWLSVYCYAVAAEVAEFAPFWVGIGEADFVRGEYELAVRFGDVTTQHPVFSGSLDINKPKNTFPMS